MPPRDRFTGGFYNPSVLARGGVGGVPFFIIKEKSTNNYRLLDEVEQNIVICQSSGSIIISNAHAQSVICSSVMFLTNAHAQSVICMQLFAGKLTNQN